MKRTEHQVQVALLRIFSAERAFVPACATLHPAACVAATNRSIAGPWDMWEKRERKRGIEVEEERNKELAATGMAIIIP